MLNSSTFQPLTTLIEARPPLIRSRLAPILATIPGEIIPGCTATINSIRLVWADSADAEVPSLKVWPELARCNQRNVKAKLFGAAQNIDRKIVEMSISSLTFVPLSTSTARTIRFPVGWCVVAASRCRISWGSLLGHALDVAVLHRGVLRLLCKSAAMVERESTTAASRGGPHHLCVPNVYRKFDLAGRMRRGAVDVLRLCGGLGILRTGGPPLDDASRVAHSPVKYV